MRTASGFAGKRTKEAAEVALAREKLSWGEGVGGANGGGEWIVARVCSEYLQYCERGVATGSLSQSHWTNSKAFLNDLCQYCGALPVTQLKKGHVQKWIDKHDTWQSPATVRGMIAIVLAVFNRADEMFGITNPIKGLKKPKSEPRLASIKPEEGQALYGATEPCFGNLLFAAIHTGLRPFCGLAKLTADDVEESERGTPTSVTSARERMFGGDGVEPAICYVPSQTTSHFGSAVSSRATPSAVTAVPERGKYSSDSIFARNSKPASVIDVLAKSTLPSTVCRLWSSNFAYSGGYLSQMP